MEEVRIGVFVCHCGSNIAGVVDIPKLLEYSYKLNNVVLVDEGKWSCSSDYLNKLQDLIKEYSINRVVIASCSARTHESLFKQAVKNAGLNPYLLEFVSIREQVSWVHMNYPKAATQKAKDLVKMGVAKAAILEEGFEVKLPVMRNCLIIGGGISGMSAALSVANQGFQAFIVEREAYLGGIIRGSYILKSGEHESSSNKIFYEILNKVSQNKNISIFTNSVVKSIEGYIGNYTVEIQKNNNSFIVPKTLRIDTVIVATGMRELKPKNQFFYGKDERILTQFDLEKQIRQKKLVKSKNFVIINCVNSKNDIRGCCNIGCHIALKNAIELKKMNEDNKIHILYRDLSIYGKSSYLLAEAKRLGINFIRFPDNEYPEVVSNKNILIVKVFDVLLKQLLKFEADKIILTTAFVGDKDVDKLKSLLKVSTNKDNFFQEAHVKLNPLEFPSDGISLCGCAKYPMFFEESYIEGLGAAMRVSISMKKGYTEADGIVADINNKDCIKCNLCLKKCPYNAVKVSKIGYPKIIKALCRGCGLCAADCPTNSISVVHYSDDQILAQISSALENNAKNKIIGFICHWCALGGVDMAGVGRLQYATNIRLIRVMCSARVSIKMIEHSFILGAAGVMVAGCEFPTCHYINGNYEAKKRIDRTKKKLRKQGFNPEKLKVTWCSAADGPKFASVVNSMAENLGFKITKI